MTQDFNFDSLTCGERHLWSKIGGEAASDSIHGRGNRIELVTYRGVIHDPRHERHQEGKEGRKERGRGKQSSKKIRFPLQEGSGACLFFALLACPPLAVLSPYLARSYGFKGSLLLAFNHFVVSRSVLPRYWENVPAPLLCTAQLLTMKHEAFK